MVTVSSEISPIPVNGKLFKISRGLSLAVLCLTTTTRPGLRKLEAAGKKSKENLYNGLFVVQFTQQEDTINRHLAALGKLLKVYDNYEVLGPERFQSASKAESGHFGAVSLVYNKNLSEIS